MKDFIYFDLETTGLSVWKDKIVELGFIYNEYERVLRFNPGRSIPEGASRIHGITDKMVQNCPPFEYLAPKIFKLFSQCRGVVGYNLRSYDLPLLQFELLRCNKDYLLPDFEIIDVYEISQSLFKSLKLKDIYLTLSGKKLERAHSSIEDIKATKTLLEIIQERFLNEKDPGHKTGSFPYKK